MENYEIRIIPRKADDETTYWTAFYPEISDCVGCGSTPEEAIEEANDNLDFLLEYLREEGKEIPKEYSETKYNGKIALRVSKSTHKRLSDLAENEGISVNLLLNNAIENYLGLKKYDYEFTEKINNLRTVANSINVWQQYASTVNQKAWKSVDNELYANVGGNYD